MTSPIDLAKSAMYQAIVADATLMARLGNEGPYDRLPSDSPHSQNAAAITFEGDTASVQRDREDATITLHVYSESTDVIGDVSADLDRLFHTIGRETWRTLSVAEGRAFIRREFAADIPDPDSELQHRVVRFRILIVRANA